MRLETIRVLGALASLLAGACLCRADDEQHFESYVTVDYGGRSAGVASSTVWSAFDPVDQPGFRLKLDGFTSVYGESNAGIFSGAFMAADLKSIADAMAGYQAHWGQYWIKLYGGAAFQNQTQIFWQVGQMVPLQNFGATAGIETYWHGNGPFWASANASWLQFDETISFYERVAYEMNGWIEGLSVSCGTEIGAIAQNANVYRTGTRLDADDTYVKAGALLNVRFWSHDLTLSGGMQKASDDGAWSPYATLSYGRKF